MLMEGKPLVNGDVEVMIVLVAVQIQSPKRSVECQQWHLFTDSPEAEGCSGAIDSVGYSVEVLDNEAAELGGGRVVGLSVKMVVVTVREHVQPASCISKSSIQTSRDIP